MPLGTHLAVNTHNMGRRFVESVKNARWSMSPQVRRRGMDSKAWLSFRSRSKDTNSESMRTNGKDGKIGGGKRLDSIVCTNADPRYAGELDDPQGGDTTLLMQQVRKVMTVNQEMEGESSWIWLTSEQMGFLLRSEFANVNHGEAESQNNAMASVLNQPHFFWCLSSQISFETQKGNSMIRSSKTRLKC